MANVRGEARRRGKDALDTGVAAALSSPRVGKRFLVVLVVVLSSLSATRAVFALCGDTVIDVGEECDDGNSLLGDCCLPDCRFARSSAPCGSEELCDAVRLGACDGAGTCVAGPAGCSLQKWCGGELTLRDEVGTGDDRLRMKTGGGRFGPILSNVTPELIGDPANDTRYALCGYDDYRPDAGSLIMYGVELAPQSGWESAEDGFVLRHGDRSPLRRAAVTAARLRLVAEGPALALPGPAGANEYFNPIPNFFFVSDAGLCAEIGQFDEAVRNTLTRFKLKTGCRKD